MEERRQFENMGCYGLSTTEREWQSIDDHEREQSDRQLNERDDSERQGKPIESCDLKAEHGDSVLESDEGT